jgi:hypothetical protein
MDFDAFTSSTGWLLPIYCCARNIRLSWHFLSLIWRGRRALVIIRFSIYLVIIQQAVRAIFVCIRVIAMTQFVIKVNPVEMGL